jgi:hypothetical protein
MADLYEAVNLNTRATGQWKGKPPKLPAWPRPQSRPKGESKAPATVASLHAMLSRR